MTASAPTITTNRAEKLTVNGIVSSGTIYANNSDGRKKPLTNKEAADLKSAITDSMRSTFANMEIVEQSRDKITKAHEHSVASRTLKTEAEGHKTAAEKFKKEAEEHHINAAKLKDSSQRKMAEAAALKESSQRKMTKAEKEGQEGLTKQFWSIFNGGTTLPKEKYDEVFNTYLVDRSLTVEETLDGKAFGRINAMNSVIKYLKANPLTKSCDFRSFNTEINDIETLADFLKTSAASAIKGVAFKSGISDVAKAKLAEAVSARANANAPLKVQYFN